ncbi:MAG: carboxypeptidase regulatory-like domain-containing protein, partial [Negativicutes bacterium]|nr:carboxypeptidase regulatory-like domain-containing protein [Negativicutes bacterium]
MAARSLWFKIVSLLVIFVLVSANSSVVRAQDATPPASTQTPPAGEPATAAPTTATSLPSTQVEASATPAAATETPLPQAPTGGPTQILPQATYSISGTVRGANGKGLPGVTVSADQDLQVQTAANGSYTIDGLAPGEHLIQAHLDNVNLVPFYRLVNVLDASVSGIDFYVPAQPLPVNASTQPMTVNYAHTLATNVTNSPPNSDGEISAQSAYKVGQSGTAYAMIPGWQIGQTGLPYQVEAVGAITHLNAPAALANDNGKLLEVEEHGNRLVRFSLSTSDLVIGDKPGISYMDNYEFNSLMAVAVQPVTGHYWLGDSTRLVEYNPDPSLTASQRFVSQFPADNPWVSGSDNAHFSEIRGIAFDSTGTVMFVSDRFNHRIQLYNVSSGKPVYIKTIGVSGVAGSDDAHFNEPWGITFSGDSLYVADSQNHRIQKCDPDNATCTTFASNIVITIKVLGTIRHYIVPFKRPTSISFNATNAFIADAERQTVDECDLNGACVDFLGTPGATGTSNTQFNWPVSVLASGSLVYVADQNNQRILGFMASNGNPYLQIGSTGSPYPDGGGVVYLNRPWGLAIDPADPNNSNGESIYVGENWGYSLAKFDSDGNLLWRLPAYPAAYGSDMHHFGNFQ